MVSTLSIVVIIAASLMILSRQASGSIEQHDLNSEWLKFKNDRGLSFDSQEEDERRKNIFASNLEKVREHNSNPHRTYNVALNDFSTMTESEFSSYLGGKINLDVDNFVIKNDGQIKTDDDTIGDASHSNENASSEESQEVNNEDKENDDDDPVLNLPKILSQNVQANYRSNRRNNNRNRNNNNNNQQRNNQDSYRTAILNNDALVNRSTSYNTGPAPSSFDWTNITTPSRVVNSPDQQGSCGSCWAFSASGALEGAFALKTGQLRNFSKQQFVDCSRNNFGCHGGFPYTAFLDFFNLGSTLETEYPYAFDQSQCTLNVYKARQNVPYYIFPHITAYGSTLVEYNENRVKQLLYEKGPLSAMLKVEQAHFQIYRQGIYSRACLLTDINDINHAVLLVGYGEENGVKYWKVKNSWGTEWGENGYFRILRDETFLCNFGRILTWPDLVPRSSNRNSNQ